MYKTFLMLAQLCAILRVCGRRLSNPPCSIEYLIFVEKGAIKLCE
jgi:hypothetical protein